MAYRESELGWAVRFDPVKAARVIAAAWAQAGTEIGTARALGCGRRSLQRWVARLEEAGHVVRPAKAPVVTDSTA